MRSDTTKCQLFINFIIFYMFFVVNESQKCIFDEIQNRNPTRTNVIYKSRKRDEGWNKRSSAPEFTPIRITPFYDKINAELNNNSVHHLQRIVDITLQTIQRLLKVEPVVGPLLLVRTACKSVYATGPNRGKCSRTQAGYKGETCIDDFQIHKEHLAGVKVWNEQGQENYTYAYTPGAGVAGSDFILYVTSFTGRRCQFEGVLAYAAYCSLDQYDRPVAGYVNFCPSVVTQYVRTKQYTLMYLTMLHEMFHTLGFASQLYPKFRDCSNTDAGDHCPQRTSDTFKRVDGILRMVTPAVIQHTLAHFGCDTRFDFGAPINVINNKSGSHWHPRFMHGSLMTPIISIPQLTYIDEMTLALLEDTGWYRVTYPPTSRYPWGKGQGCDFGKVQSCGKDKKFFCQGSGSYGCDPTHTMKAKCRASATLDPCHIYQPQLNDSCEVRPSDVSMLELRQTGEEYGQGSGCVRSDIYMTNATQSKKGRCYKMNCTQWDELQIFIDGSWIDCPLGQSIQVAGYHGSIECPQRGVVCRDPTSPNPHPDLHETLYFTQRTVQFMSNTSVTKYRTIPTTTPPWDDSPPLTVTLVLRNYPYSIVVELQLETPLTHAVWSAMVQRGVAHTRLRDFVILSGSVHVSFTLLPAEVSSQGVPSPAFIKNLTHDISRGHVEVSVRGYTFKVVDLRMRNQIIAVQPQTPTHPLTPTVIGVVVAVVVVLLLVLVAWSVRNHGYFKCVPCRSKSRMGTYHEDDVISTNV